MKSDISSRADIKIIITLFYDKMLKDKIMLPFFKEIVAQKHLEKHLEIITDFWEDLLLQSYKYKNNPMQKHLDFAKKMPFNKKHFELWLKYLHSTIDENYKGQVSHNMKTKAQSIATIMQLKLNLF